MAAKKKKPQDKGAGASGSTRSLRDEAEKELTRSPKRSPTLKGQTAEELTSELRVHQIEFETQAEELRRAHLALEESRDKYLDLYEFAPLGYLTLNNKTRVTEANLTGATILGVERHNLIGARFRKFVAEKDFEQWVLYFANVLNQGENQTCTLNLTRGDGSVFPARLEGVQLTGSDGAITVRIAISDITDIRLAEETLKERLKELNCFYGISALLELPGISLNEILKRTVLLLPPAWQFPNIAEACIVLEGQTFQTAHFRETSWMLAHEIMVNDNPVGRVVVCYLEDRQGSNESPFIREERHLLNAIAERLGHIIERKRAEVALIEREEKFRDIFNTINDGIHIHEIEPDGKPGKFIEVNEVACRMLHYTHDELLEHGPLDFVTGYHNRPVNEIFGELASTGHAIFETEHLRKDGTIVPVEINSRVVSLQGKRMIVAVVRDITERKRAENALALASRKLSVMSSITRHDILNQITALRMYIELAKEETDTEMLAKFSSTEEKIVDALERQINFTREYQDIGATAPEWQNVNASIQKAVAGLPMRAVRVEVDPANPEVYADPLFLKVFYNLIDNALIYGGELMKTIRVSSQESDASLTIICEDDGVGISAEDKKRLFTRGFGKNTGLGLFLSREILAITGITITETGEQGKGARFEITVPKGMWRMKGANE